MSAPDPGSAALAGVSTPALVVDVAALDRNIAAMAERARSAGVLLRPHIKTHKCADIARRQLAAGAAGLACATVAELRHLVECGFNDILLTSPVADALKCDLIAAASRHAEIAVVVDHPDQVALVDAAMARAGGRLKVLVDIDVGQNRAGVADIAACVAAAKVIESAENLVFAGIQGFAGQAQHIVDVQARREAARDVAEHLRRCADAVRREGLAVDCITGSGTGTSVYDTDGPFSELQVGSYLFMDADYARLLGHAGEGLGFEKSLFVLATVVSVNKDGQVTIDAGVKAFAQNGPVPKLMLGIGDGAEYRFAGDEHGILALKDGMAAPALGSRILLEATHCDPTVNLYAGYNALHPDGSQERWQIGGRYA
ncbi:alanine racemase [Mesorhizobium sp. A556]